MAPEVVLPARVRDALSPLPTGYADLLRSVVDLLAARTEVRAVWVSGSVGREAADAGSDLDLVVTVADDALEMLSDPAVWEPLDPLLCLSLPFLPGAAVITTRAGLRLDVVLERVTDLPSTPYRRRLVVLDRDGSSFPRWSRRPVRTPRR